MRCLNPFRPQFLCLTAGLGVLFGGFSALDAQTAPVFSRFIVFGDSLSDTGNDANVSKDKYGVTFPGEDFNYTTGRFTCGSDTDPASSVYSGVWHEQLAKLFFGLPAAKNSLNGGMDYAYGGATTQDGTSDLGDSTGVFKELNVSITVNDMGAQISDYLAHNSTDPKALYIVWGGANDLFNSDTNANGIAAADREAALIQRLAQAGAATFLVPNLPPLGSTPEYLDHDSKITTQATLAFNQELTADLDNLVNTFRSSGLPVKIYRLNVYNLFEKLLLNQYAYGFTDIKDSAQGLSVKANQYLFWDGVHPTVAGHYQLAAEAYTVLTGIPVVELNVLPGGTLDSRGALSLFYITRTGNSFPDVLTVPYTVGGTAVEGADYTSLKGQRDLAVNQRTAAIAIFQGTNPPSSPAKTVSLTLGTGTGYKLPVMTTQQVKLLPQPSGE